MRRIVLHEYRRSEPVALLPGELMRLPQLAPQLRITPSQELDGRFVLTADSRVGVIRLGKTTIEIRPLVPIDRFFFLLSYCVDPALWRKEVVALDAQDTVLEAIAPAFCRLVAEATYRGLLHGYRAKEDASPLVRGQVRFGEQMRRRHGLPLPIELRFDEFTEDIEENRILPAALHRLSRLPLRSEAVRRGRHEVTAALHAVTLVRYTALEVPQISFSRLNAHYEPAVSLATLILKWASLELGSAEATGTSFLVDMNEMFELFVHRALREALGLSETEFPRGSRELRLDEAGNVTLASDLSWWSNGCCRFVGDVKYKRINVPGIRHPDLYQLLAYLTASNLPAGLLVYAAGEGVPARHQVRHADKTLIVESLDLASRPEEILGQIAGLSSQILHLAEARPTTMVAQAR